MDSFILPCQNVHAPLATRPAHQTLEAAAKRSPASFQLMTFQISLR